MKKEESSFFLLEMTYALELLDSFPLLPYRAAFHYPGTHFTSGLELMVIYCKLILATIFWGGTFTAGRLLAQDMGPFSAGFLRFLVASLILAAVALRTESGFTAIRKDQWLWVILLGLTGVFAYNLLFFLGLKTVIAGRAALIVATNPIFITLLSALLFKDRITPLKGLGILVCVLGASVVISRGNPASIVQDGVGWGELFLLGCVASWTAYSLIGKRAMRDLSPLTAVTWSCIIGAALLLPPALAEGLLQNLGGFSTVDWASILYLGIFGTGLGFFWYYQGIKAIGTTRAGVFINLVPVSAVLLGFFVLGEPVSLSLLVGALLVLAGLTLTNLQGLLQLRSRALHPGIQR
jgi:drug/metabolite transporter (DMT)-like permease